jgi:hypothetical protein
MKAAEAHQGACGRVSWRHLQAEDAWKSFEADTLRETWKRTKKRKFRQKGGLDRAKLNLE